MLHSCFRIFNTHYACLYGTPFWTKIRSHGAILSLPRSSIAVPRTLHVPRSMFLDPRSPFLDPCSSNPPRSSIYDRRSSTLDGTLYVPRSIISTSVRSFHCTMHNSTLATTPRLSNLQSWSDSARHPDCTPASFILHPSTQNL